MELQNIIGNVCKVIETYSEKFSISRKEDWYILKLQEEIGELTKAYLNLKGETRNKLADHVAKQNFEDELADSLAMLLILSQKHNIDIEKALERKWFKYLT